MRLWSPDQYSEARWRPPKLIADCILQLEDLTGQAARTPRHSTAQYLVPVLRTPDHVILEVENRVRAMSVFRQPLIAPERGTKLLKADHLQCVGVRLGGRS